MVAADGAVPALTRAQVAEVDRLCGERFGLPLDWLMEAAGWQIARHCRGRTAVLCGTGNNGGDGLAAARHLHRWGRLHSISITDPERLSGPAGREAAALEAAGVRFAREPVLEGAQLVLDAILGTGLNRPAEGLALEWISRINGSGHRVIAADIPSGLDADEGRVLGQAVRAAVTVTLGLPKAGLLIADGPACAGTIWVVDIGIPAQAHAMVGANVPAHLFAMHDRVELAGVRL